MDAYFDIFSGISGNMILGGLIDLGLEQEKLEEELDKLGLSNEYKIKTKKVAKEGIGGTYVEVELLDDEDCDHHDHQGHHAHNHEHQHEHHTDHQDYKHHGDNHDHDHSHSHTGEHEHSHPHDNVQADHSHHEQINVDSPEEHSHQHTHSHGRNLSDINHIIDNSTLSESVKQKSKDIFLNLARAEAKIHGKGLDEIHFHEVGAVDAIVDIVGTVIGFELLGIDNIYASRVHTGTGFVHCDHGFMPVPAPATMELLQGVPVYSRGIEAELVTPTGAAIITTLAREFGPRPEIKVEKTGYGAGSRDLEIPNLLRINLGQVQNQKKKMR